MKRVTNIHSLDKITQNYVSIKVDETIVLGLIQTILLILKFTPSFILEYTPLGIILIPLGLIIYKLLLIVLPVMLGE